MGEGAGVRSNGGDVRNPASAAPDLAARLEAREAQLQRMRSGLSEEKRAALERRLRGAAAGTPGAQTAQPNHPIIPRRPARSGSGDHAGEPDIQPTSFAQERLWFLAQLDPDSLAYSLPAAVRLDGALDLPALRLALTAVVRRHESLRTTFANQDGQPVQRIAPPGVTELPVVDLSGIEARDAEARRLTREAAQRPFDLAAGPLFAPLLLRESATRATLVLTIHHIVTDAWSMGVLVRELAAVYGGSAVVLPELPIQYADYARWQRGWLTGAVLEKELAYWRERLAGLSPALELPADHPRPAMASGRGGRRGWHADAALTARLRALTQEGGATIFMLLLAVFEALLGRLAGETDVAVGVPVAGRTRVETEGLIGFFVNTLVLRLDLRGAPDLRTLLARSRDATLGAFAHQEVPFERLVTELRPERAAARNPLFQAAFVLQNAPAEPLRLPGLTLAAAPAATGGSLFDLTLEVVEVPDGLVGYLEYSHDLFDGTTASRLARCFMTFLAAAAADPAQRFDDLPWLAEVERHQVLHEWSGGPSPYPRSATIHGLFLDWVRRKPDAVALTAAGISADEDLSYAALAAHASRLARRLRAWGVGPETPVALCLGRSPHLIIALLAILEAGGAYMPLDPAYPRERLELMLDDLRQDRGGRTPLLLTEERFAGLFPWFAEAGGRLVRLDRPLEDEPEDEQPAPEIDPEIDPENLAYIFYTSGSTGRPKGVAVHHRGVIRVVRDTVYAHFSADDVLLQLSTISFDISTFEIWGALLNGGRLVLMPPETPTVEILAKVLERQRVSTLLMTPALLHQMIDDNLAGLSAVRQLVAGGDVLSPPHIRRLLAAFPGLRVVNGYGPTENTVFTTGGPLPVGVGAAALPPGAQVPIGRPVNNTDAFVVCGEDRTEPFAPLAPIGVTGELITGGDGLARGYWHRPELTAERFRPHPFAESPGERVYHTGDRVRALADGRFDFFGRMDRQVKIRGFRIEPAEVEAAIAGHPEIREAVVVAAPERGAGGGKRLIAYLVPREPATGLPSGLRAWLRQRLPEHMVPQSFVTMAELPLSANGKIDRAALPSPESLEAGGETADEAPRSPEEELLAGIWADVLGRERIGLRDDFFDLGGHSLLATRVVSRIREVFGVELPLRRLFDAPTVAALAVELAVARRQADGGQASSPSKPPQPVSRDRELPLSFAQERLWFLDQLEPGGTAYNLALPVALHGRLHRAALAAAVAAVESRHETLRTRFPERGGQAHQEIAPACATADLPLIDLSALPETPEPFRQIERDRLVADLAAHRFDLARGPLVRWTLLRVDPDEHVFVIAQHHIISDGWSIGVLVRELASLYTAFAAGEPSSWSSRSSLPPPPLQYADYAVWQRELAQAGGFEPQLAYWRERLSGELPALDLPTDRPRTPGISRRGGSATLELPPALAARVTAASRRAGATPFMTFVAAWKALLHRLSGQDDLLAGLPIAGRNRGEIESTLGFFINTLVLRTDLGGNPSFRALLAQVREAALGAYANQDLPFEHLVAALQPERDLDRTPLFQVFFNHLNLAANQISLPGLTLAPVVSQPPSSKFDLTVYVSEGGGGFRFDVLYDAGLFDAVRIEEMLAQLEQLLTAVLADPDLATGIDDVSLITSRVAALLPDPAQELAGGWLGGMEGDGAPVHELFARQAQISPAHPAAIDADGVWTYGALDAAANRLAHQLIAEGRLPGDVVAIAAERRAALAGAVLGVLKAGCAFLLLDPEYPEARRNAMVRLGGARTVVQLADANDLDDPGAPQVSVGPDDPAYVAFTSGSTGEPKAILGTHAPLTHFTAWYAATFGLNRDDRFSLLSGLGHDPLLRDLLVPLALGATVCAPPAESLGVPERLLAWMAAERVTVAHLTPAYGQLLAPHPLTPSPTPLPASGRGGTLDLERVVAPLSRPAGGDGRGVGGEGLRFAFFGGDRLTAADVARLRSLAPDARVVSFYGATETPQAMGWFEAHDETGVVPLGRGIDSVQLLVRTGRGGWAGIGEQGEVVVRTPFLTRGYLGDAALTGERFLPDATANSRIYRTGDLGRYRPDGCVEPAGRADRQIKIRGFRVEPAEIETALAAEPGVAEAAVVFHEGQLIAFVVPRGSELPDLRRSLSLRLPSYMVPASIVTLDKLPLTPNRKVDRQALLRQVPEPSAQAALYTAPRDPIEEMIAGIWAEVLGPRRTGGRVGVHDSFFALGGHSLLATQVLSRLRQAFAVEMPLRSLFEHPTVAGLATAVRTLRTAGAQSAEPPLLSVPRSAPLPLSFAQESLWVFEQLSPGTATYNMPVALRLLGPARPEVLAAGLEEVTRRQESLRTTFVSSGTGPVQMIAPSPLAVPLLPLIDLSALVPERREETARQLAAAEAVRPFELTRGPLWRSRLLRLAADDHALLLTAHHIICDGWSIGVLAAELSALYAAFISGRPSPLPELAVQYADYAAWQRRTLGDSALAAQLAWWRSRLDGAPALLELPTDRPRPAHYAHRGARIGWELPADVASALTAAARRHGATPFMLLLAAFDALLSRHSGQDDLVVGLSIAHRNRVEIEPLIGFFVNMLALRADLHGDPPFLRLLEQARDTALGALDHQDVPFERLVAELRPERGAAHPLFQVLCTLQNMPLTMRMPGLTLAPFGKGSQAAHFDLTLSLGTGGDDAIGGYLEYDTELFDATTAHRLVAHFTALLAAVAVEPDLPLSALPILGAGEQQQLCEWNDTTAAFPADRCLHELISAQARRTPEALAIAGTESLTFAALDAASDRLATRLRTLGLGPDRVAVLYLERSAILAVALLAVLKAGGAYLPIDLADPRERVAWVLQDASPRLILTRSGLVQRLPKQRAETVFLDVPEGEGPTAVSAHTGPTPDNLAYIIYTSGSTGRPKGTMIPHRGVVSYLSWAVRAYRVAAGTGAPVHTPLAFDLTVTSLLAPWLAGRCAVLVPEEDGVEALGLALADPALPPGGFSLVKLTPAHLPLLAEQPGAVVAGRTRALVIGGDALRGESLEAWRRAAPETRVINEYGPTETVVGCCVYEAPAGAIGDGPVPIGRPIANARLYVVDCELRPVPLDTPGELLIGGAGLARGYLRRSELTAERFVPDMAGDGGRLYRTGDRVRQRADGVLEYLGRLDDQVKIRGFRIELGEVQAALASHSSLADAAVVAFGTAGAKRLIAYVVPHFGEEAASATELRRHLKARLPEFMVPSAFVELPELPLTANGKLDKKALPVPEEAVVAAPVGPHPPNPPLPSPPLPPGEGGTSLTPDSGEPRTPAEAILVRIWAQLLRLPRVGIHDNFFELGGDSILSLQVASRARAEGLKIKSRDLFQHQTVAQLAAIAVPMAEAKIQAPAAVETSSTIPLTPIQRWFFELGHAEPSYYNQTLVLQLRRPLSPAVLAAAVGHLVERHEALRLRFSPDGRQTIAPPDAPVPFTVIDLSALAVPAPAIEAASAALQGGLDLTAGPILRVAYFALGSAHPARLLVAIHHLAIDGVSWRILLEDLETACDQTQRGEPVRLLSPAGSFQRWALHLTALAQTAEIAAELPYWLAEERGRVPPLPSDGPSPDALDLRRFTRRITTSLDEAETEALLRQAPVRLQSQVEELLLAAVTTACRRWTGSPALLIDLEGHGRDAGQSEDLDVSHTVGWFTTIAPVLFDLTAVPLEAGASAAVPEIRRQLRAVPHRGAGYGLLRYLTPRKSPLSRVEGAGWERGLGGEGSARLLFNYFGQIDAALLPDSRFSPAPESAGENVSPRNRRSHPLQLDAVMAGGRLHLNWSYSAALHRPETIERLAHDTAEELKRLLGIGCDGGDGLAGAESVYPLTPMQQGILFHSRLAAEPAGSTELYVAQFNCALHGPLDLDAFRGAWQQVIDRHAVLRTSFHWTGLDRPLQAVRHHIAAPLAVLDWRSLGAAEQPARLAELLRADRHRGFEVRQAPLLRITLLRLADSEHRMIFSFHHLLLDGWSMPLLFGELLRLYEALRTGERLTLPPPLPYRDYVDWLARMDAASPGAAETFWRGELAGFTAPTPLPLEARPDREAFGATDATRRFHPLTADETGALQRLARRGHVTVGTLVQGAWALLLARHAATEDVLFGATSSGRPAELPGAEGMLGLFIATLPVRVAVDPARSVLPWLDDLQQHLARLREMEHVPLAEIQRWSDVPRGTALFESLVVFENYPVDLGAGAGSSSAGSLRIGGLQAVQNTNYPLTLVGALHGDVLVLRLAFDGNRHTAPPVLRALAQLATLLRAMGASTEDGPPLGDLPLLGAAERQQLVHEWSDTDRAPAAGPLLHRLFEQRTAETPAATALLLDGEALSYGEIEARAARLAAALRRRGVGPETLVALALHRSVWLPIAQLAVWKAGGAFLPLDPAYPAERLAFMLGDSGAEFLVTDPSSQTGPLEPHPPNPPLPSPPHPPGEGGRATVNAWQEAGGGAPLPVDGGTMGEGTGVRSSGGPRAVSIDELLADPADLPGLPYRSEPSLNALAYVIYTSGSTGTPKGVMIEHCGLANLMRAQIEAFGITPQSRVLQLASASFDASVSEIWTAWTAGAALVMLPEGGITADASLLRRLEQNAVSVATFPPSLLATLPHAELPALATLVVAGEAANAAVLSRWSPGRSRVLNAYGPTEITVCATLETYFGNGEALLGRPMQNTRVRLLDDRQQPVAIGAVGEICLAGIGLARGYLARPELTAARFVPDPWRPEPGERMYRTGDLARWTAAGKLAFLGRRDEQVKVRGVRIETGEVEAALARHPDVRACAVVARGDGLIAYVAADPAGSPWAAGLRSFLQQSLPDSMLPGRFVELAELPRTPNGKLDRRALPDPEAVARPRSAPPSSDLERYLAGVWSEILGVTGIGVDDDFFQLGGHSLSGATVVGRLQQDLGEIVHVVVMYDAPTVGRLAAYLTEHYPEAIRRRFGGAVLPVEDQSRPAPPIGATEIAELRRIVAEGSGLDFDPGVAPRNPPAVFVLSPPRSGSTLLRVMLAGHPDLFAPPELELLSFETLAGRRAAFAGRNSFWLEGAVRALMEIEPCDAGTAEALVTALEAAGATTQDLYRRLQERIAPRLLVDKTPSYALDPAVLARAERRFADARYIHLLRHPLAMIRSFEEARLDQVFFRFPHRFSRRQLAELIWTVSEENILAFLATVAPERCFQLRFEALVARPDAEMRRLCDWLGIDFHPSMAEPYRDKASRMTDGIHPWSRMLGDVKFHDHRAVDPAAADRWRESMRGHVLGRPTIDLAARLGYDCPRSIPSALVPLQPRGARPPLICVHPAGGDVLCYRDLAQALSGDRPVYGLQAQGVLAGETPLTRLEAIAERSVALLLDAYPTGPYYLAGWSFGGLVVYEMARRLAAAGHEVALLAILDAGPHQPTGEGDDAPRYDDADILAADFQAVLPVTAEEIRALPAEDRLPQLFARARATGKLPPGVDLAYVQRLLATFQAHQAAARAYRPGPYPGRLILLRAAGGLAARPDRDPALGWSSLAAAVEIHEVPGDHETMAVPPHVTALADCLRRCLG